MGLSPLRHLGNPASRPFRPAPPQADGDNEDGDEDRVGGKAGGDNSPRSELLKAGRQSNVVPPQSKALLNGSTAFSQVRIIQA